MDAYLVMKRQLRAPAVVTNEGFHPHQIGGFQKRVQWKIDCSWRNRKASDYAPDEILFCGSGGRATGDEGNEAIAERARLCEVAEVDEQRNGMAAMMWTNAWLRDAKAPNWKFLFSIARN